MAKNNKNKPTEEQLARRCGQTVEQWRRTKEQSAAARTRGKRPTDSQRAEAKLATWGGVEGQTQLFGCDHRGNVR